MKRYRGPEWMDDEQGFGLREVRETFQFLPRANRWFGGIRPTLAFFRRESKTWDPQQTIRILDAGCGIGDVAVALVRWARRAGYRLQIQGVDHLPAVVELARQNCRDYPEIEIAAGDALTWQGQAYDYVHASQFVHHFPDEEVVALLRHLLGLCRRAVVINDLVRAPLAYAATWVFTLWTSRTFRHDGRLSVRRGFQPRELAALLRAGGLPDFCLETHFFYRFLLVLRGRDTTAN